MKLVWQKVEKTVHSFIEGDEVYKITGDGTPLGMVTSIGRTKVKVKKHSNGKEVRMCPKDLYLGKDWHEYNKVETEK